MRDFSRFDWNLKIWWIIFNIWWKSFLRNNKNVQKRLLINILPGIWTLFHCSNNVFGTLNCMIYLINVRSYAGNVKKKEHFYLSQSQDLMMKHQKYIFNRLHVYKFHSNTMMTFTLHDRSNNSKSHTINTIIEHFNFEIWWWKKSKIYQILNLRIWLYTFNKIFREYVGARLPHKLI